MKPFLEFAKQYNRFGFNIIPLIITKAGKKPALKSWKELQHSKQSFTDLEKLSWNNKVNGIGGINNIITSIDFDKCEDENFVLNFANELGINSWIVKTGFGYHIHFRIKDVDNINKKFGDKSFHTFYPKEKSILSHCELRIRDCYTALPPSKHYNGKTYTFISGIPKDVPEEVSTKKIIDVLQKQFILENESGEVKNCISKETLVELITNGTLSGNRHNILLKNFGILSNSDLSKDFILAYIKNWNKNNNPPLSEKEVEQTVNDLWERYSKGLNGKFHQFDNILMSLNYDVEKKLKMILCYSVIQYKSDAEILKELGLNSVKKQYHKECKELVKKNNERTQKKDQIVRVGEDLIIDVINRKVKYDYFSVYVGIISYLGRRYKAKRISDRIIAYRAIGYKNYMDWFDSECSQKPLSRYKINQAAKYLEVADYIRTFYLKKGQMNYYSTRIKTKNELAEFAGAQEKKKWRKKIDVEKIRQRELEGIRDMEAEYIKLKQSNISINPSLL